MILCCCIEKLLKLNNKGPIIIGSDDHSIADFRQSLISSVDQFISQRQVQYTNYPTQDYIIITQIITAFTTSFRLHLVVDIDCAQCIHIICFMVHIHN